MILKLLLGRLRSVNRLLRKISFCCLFRRKLLRDFISSTSKKLVRSMILFNSRKSPLSQGFPVMRPNCGFLGISEVGILMPKLME